MSRGLVLLIVAAAAASAQQSYSPCLLALFDASDALEIALDACSTQYEADIDKFENNPKCRTLYYDAATCDPLVANFNKCGTKAVKLLKADNTFDEAAFKETTLKNKCSADAKFIAAYPKCKISTMKYFNYHQLLECLIDAEY
ncbi:uncharacterized protein LOC108670506 [Hyalella azteca]|uniref:Uncharacterized protein LOC108670506 n=1 Tax=Hyalella azteca TaxID=294128 RepID=A0A8B7NIK9_HYAAZ|nr:uncharacterized protein LOC108670506 [Hyalella azteca]